MRFNVQLLNSDYKEKRLYLYIKSLAGDMPSEADIAKLIGINRGNFNRIRKGKLIPGELALIKIAKFFGRLPEDYYLKENE